MTLKYESEILFDLMKRDGDDTPSDVLPYESELKEKYLQQVEGAYPKLQDYRSEWLNYNLYGHIPANFPVESVSNVTNATVDNVVPYAYGTAILRGCTLDNVVSSCLFSNTTKYFKIELNKYKNNQSYMIIIFNAPNNVKRIYVGSSGGSSIWVDYTKDFIKNKNCIMLKITCPSNYDGATLLPHFKYENDEEPSSINNIKCMLIEYQDGMENWDIPYFEGMQSVKMPGLTTTGKNLCDINKYIHGGFSNSMMIFKEDTYRSYYMKCKPSTVYSVKVENSNNRFGVASSHLFSEDTPFTLNKHLIANGNDVTGQSLEFKITTTEKDKYLYVYVANNGVFNPNIRIQVEESSTATPYEPHKSIILTVNEDVTLRGIGDVQDKLDCLTGEVTESIGEIVLDGTQDMVSDGYGVYIQVDDVKRFLDYTDKIACDKLPVIPSYWDLENVENGISGFTNSSSYLGQNWLYVKINNSVNTDEVKEWLTQKPITVQYQLAQESIKTVDLTSTDQDGNTESIIRPIEGTMHVSTSSQTLPPLLDMSVPVEATSQNLMSFANIIEEEK